MKREELQTMCLTAGILPVHRSKSKHGHIFVADGFQAKPFPIWKSIGVDSELEFPAGAYCTFWMVANDDDDITGGQPLLFDPDHNCDVAQMGASEGWDDAMKKQARINTALAHAHSFLDHRDRIRSERPHLHG